MNQNQIDILTYRATIINNIDKLTNYGKKYQKNSIGNQLSLFNDNTCNLEKIKLDTPELSIDELEYLASKEVEYIGIPIVYNIYDKYSIIQKTLATHSFNDVLSCTKDNTRMNFVAQIKDIDTRTSQWGNIYAKVFFSIGETTQYMYLSGDSYKKNIGNIFVNRIHLVRCEYKNMSYSILKAEPCDNLDVRKYINKVTVNVLNINKLEEINNYIFAKMRNKGIFALEFIALDTKYPMNYKVDISSENINYLSTIGADISITTKF